VCAFYMYTCIRLARDDDARSMDLLGSVVLSVGPLAKCDMLFGSISHSVTDYQKSKMGILLFALLARLNATY